MKFSELLSLLKVKSLDTLEDRIILQKKIYFLREVFKVLVSPAYSYSWYLYGPYSSEVARDGFAWFRDSSDRKDVEVDKAKIPAFEKFADEIDEDATRWEMAASIHFLKKIHLEFSKEKIFDEVSKKRSYLADQKLFEEIFRLLESISH